MCQTAAISDLAQTAPPAGIPSISALAGDCPALVPGQHPGAVTKLSYVPDSVSLKRLSNIPDLTSGITLHEAGPFGN